MRASARTVATRASPSGDVASCRRRSSSATTARLARTSSADSIDLVSASLGGMGARSRPAQGAARLLAGVALREVTHELVPGLPRVGLALLSAIGETEAEQGLRRVLAFRREIDRLPVLQRSALEVARGVVRLTDPELRRRRQGVGGKLVDELLEVQHGLPLLALLPALHRAVEE